MIANRRKCEQDFRFSDQTKRAVRVSNSAPALLSRHIDKCVRTYVLPPREINLDDLTMPLFHATMMNASQQQPGGAIVVVAKCPIPNKSKTRLIPLLGEEGSAKFAQALLSDVLVALSTCVSRLWFAYTETESPPSQTCKSFICSFSFSLI